MGETTGVVSAGVPRGHSAHAPRSSSAAGMPSGPSAAIRAVSAAARRGASSVQSTDNCMPMLRPDRCARLWAMTQSFAES